MFGPSIFPVLFPAWSSQHRPRNTALICRETYKLYANNSHYMPTIVIICQLKYHMPIKIICQLKYYMPTKMHTSYLSFSFTDTFWGLKILHSKARKFTTKVNHHSRANYKWSVKLHTVFKITHCVINYTLCVKLHSCVKLHTVCEITHCTELHILCKITHWMSILYTVGKILV